VFRDKADFEDFCERAEKLAKQKKPPVFVIGKKRPVYSDDTNILVDETDSSMRCKEVLQIFPCFLNQG